MSGRVEPACPASADPDHREVSADHPAVALREPCSLCFEDGEIPPDVDAVCYRRQGNHVHRTRDANGPISTNGDPGFPDQPLATDLARDDVTSLEDLREVRADGGE